MWVCPKCGREFKRQNQDHYCGNPPISVAEYIEAQDEVNQKHLTELVMLIHSAVPDIVEEIKWSMPSFRKNKASIQFAAFKKHISLYVGADTINIFQENLSDLSCKKDAVYLPYNSPLPAEIIKAMLRWIFTEEGERKE